MRRRSWPAAWGRDGAQRLRRRQLLGVRDGIRTWCHNVSGAAVYGSIGNNRRYPDPTTVVGHMYSNPSWFYCKLDNQAWVGGPHPTRWVLTVADNGQLGWMKDTAIYSETNPLRDC
ncbi:hypothetical protein ABTX62_12080 [Streptomyces sp. NPDC096046]|uniref:hypothetical protein n=1 Tax=Streptomyces sp. NPDC096046 TaxID=3155542 RepID=UPI003317A1FA